MSKIQAVLDAIIKRTSKGAAQLLSQGAESDVEEVISTGIDVLDHYVLKIGGWPVGRIVELYAAEGDGKSSLMLQSMAGVQRDDGVPVLAETEYALESQRAVVFGCDLDQVILSQPETLEETLAFIEATLDAFPKTKKGDPPFGIFWDSLAATPTKREIEEGIEGSARVGERAKLMSAAMRNVTRLCVEKRTLLMVVNQTRTKIGVMFGPNKTTPGGDALKFHASVRLEMFSGKSVKVGVRHIGKQVTMMAAKTKIGSTPWAKAKVRLYYENGWSNLWSTINHAKDMKLLPPAATATPANYIKALEALQWVRGWAGGKPPTEEDIGDVEDIDQELLGDVEDDNE